MTRLIQITELNNLDLDWNLYQSYCERSAEYLTLPRTCYKAWSPIWNSVRSSIYEVVSVWKFVEDSAKDF